MNRLTEGKPVKVILLFAVPLLIGRLFQLFYSLVDTRIVGETLGEAALAAVGSTTTLSDLLVALLDGLTNGFAIIIAVFFGSKDERNMKQAIGGTILLGAGSAAAVSIVCLIFLGPILSFLHIDESILEMAAAYISILLAGLLVTTMYNVCAAVLRAVGDSFTPLIFLIIAAFLNIFLDYLLILYAHMGVAGAALATVIAQAVSVLLCFCYMKKRYPDILPGREDFRISGRVCKKLLTTGISMSFMSSFVSLGTLALQTSINTFGSDIIVAHVAARKIGSVFMLPFSVFGTTLATYCGQNLGAGKYGRIRAGLRDTVMMSFVWVTGVIVIARVGAPALVRLVTASSKQEILDTASLYLRVNTSFYYVPAVINLFRNSMQGFGDSRTPVFSSALELIGKMLIAAFLAPAIGYMGIIVAEPIVWFVMVVPLIVNMVRNPIFRAGKEHA